MKKYFRKLQPSVINFGSHQDLFNKELRKDLKRKVASQIFVNNFDSLRKDICEVIKCLSLQKTFQSVMEKSRLENKFLKNKSEENRVLCAR